MGNLVKRKGKLKLFTSAAVATGGVISLVFISKFAGLILLALSVYLFWGVVKYYAQTGQRF